MTLLCGDTVNIPAGTSTWAVQVTLAPPTGCAANQGVTVIGATTCTGTPGVQVATCVDLTNITINVDQGFSVGTCSNTAFCTITGVTLIAGTAAGHALLAITGTHAQQSFRAHHFHIKNALNSTVMLAATNGYGLIDHYLADDTAATPGTPFNSLGDFPTRGYTPWTDATNPGSAEAHYIEDSRATSTNMNNAEGYYDAYAGCKVVIRYSTLSNYQVGGWHGTDSGQYRGCVLGEIYNNTITNSSGTTSQVMNTRSGTLLFHDNTIGGSTAWTGIPLNYYRISQQIAAECQTWGCVGTGGINWTPLSTSTVADHAYLVTANAPDWQSTHAYASGAVIGPLTNNAGIGAGFPCDGTCGGYNFQAAGACTSGGSNPNPWNQTVGGTQADGGCTWTNVGGATAAITQDGFDSVNPDTPGGNQGRYFDANGGVYPFRDQPGTIHNQVVYGNYAWNNTLPGSLSASTLMVCDGAGAPTCTTGAVQTGRDFFNNTAKGGYTPYTYPHPLQGALPTPPAPCPKCYLGGMK